MDKGHVVYGDPLNFKSLSCAPVNEKGVIYLFGVLHDVFGIQIQAIRDGFPDCLARRKVGPGKWREVRIEFEHESRSFSVHKHDPAGADIIVCWKDNWEGRPKHLEVIELSSFVRDAERLTRSAAPKSQKLSEWQLFARKHRLTGKSFSEISKLWKAQKNRGKVLGPWQLFVKSHAKKGMSTTEIAALWRRRKARTRGR